MVEFTRTCLAKLTIDSTESPGLMVQHLYKEVTLLSSIACFDDEPEVDSMACINNYKRLGLELLGTQPSSRYIM